MCMYEVISVNVYNPVQKQERERAATKQHNQDEDEGEDENDATRSNVGSRVRESVYRRAYQLLDYKDESELLEQQRGY